MESNNYLAIMIDLLRIASSELLTVIRLKTWAGKRKIFFFFSFFPPACFFSFFFPQEATMLYRFF